MRDLFNPNHHARIIQRIQNLDPEEPARWGRLTAPRMVAHLSDGMRVTLGEQPSAPIRGPGRLPVLREMAIYLLPWPKGKIQAPPESFLTDPGDWEAGTEGLKTLIERFGESDLQKWPDHPMFGRMSRRDWGVFCHRHLDYHLRQFGV